MTKTNLLNAYEQLWNNHSNPNFQSILDRGYVFQYDEDETECELLFLGINPSFDEKGERIKDAYSRPKNREEKHHPYFRSFLDFEDVLRNKYKWEGKWTHFDVFAFRQTNQKYIETDLLTNPEAISFLYDQLMIARERILHIQPKVIVVSNALVRMFMGKERTKPENGEETGIWMGFRYEFDPKIGTDVIMEPIELKGTKVFFSSMLSGQRALDKGSKESLVWHVAKVLGLKMEK